jgi:hypothetical protein
MPSQTPKLAIPYPVGTDRVMDGDNAMQSIAEKVDAIFGTARSANLTKSIGVTGFKPAGYTDVPASHVNLTMTAPGVALIRASLDAGGLTGIGFLSVRIGADEATMTQHLESPAVRVNVIPVVLLYLPSGVTNLGLQVNTFANPAPGIALNSVMWSVIAMGGTPSIA